MKTKKKKVCLKCGREIKRTKDISSYEYENKIYCNKDCRREHLSFFSGLLGNSTSNVIFAEHRVSY